MQSQTRLMFRHKLRTLLILLAVSAGCMLASYCLHSAAHAACDWIWNLADKSFGGLRIHPAWFRL